MNSVKKARIFELLDSLDKRFKDELDAKRHSPHASDWEIHDLEVKLDAARYIKSQIRGTKHLKNKTILKCLERIEDEFNKGKPENWEDTCLKIKVFIDIEFHLTRILNGLSE
jgi:hypothetical protein